MEFFKELLIAKKNELEKIQSELHEEELQIESDNKSDMGEVSYLHKENNVVSIIGYKIKKELADINYALQRLENGDYGTCADCGEEINIKRLQAQPMSKLCINCQSYNEHKKSA